MRFLKFFGPSAFIITAVVILLVALRRPAGITTAPEHAATDDIEIVPEENSGAAADGVLIHAIVPAGAPQASQRPATIPPRLADADWRLVYGTGWDGPMPPEMAAFRDWAERYRAVDTPAARARLEAEGVALATARRPVMLDLIVRDPARALAVTAPAAVLQDLPVAVVHELENRVAGRGDLQLVCAMPVLGAREAGTLSREAIVDGAVHVAHVYGRRSEQQTETGASLHGIALGGQLALHESPLRVLERGEAPARAVWTIDPVNGEMTAPADAVVVEAHGALWLVEAGDGLAVFERRLVEGEDLPGPNVPPVAPHDGVSTPPVEPLPPTAWTTGNRQLLVIRVDFSDQPGEEMSQQFGLDLINNSVSPYYDQASYGATSITPTVTETIYRMPQTAAYYTGSSSTAQLYTDAVSSGAAGSDFVMANYHHVMIVFPRITVNNTWSWAGLAQVGGGHSWINGYYDFRVTAHELGHNYGLFHANLWQVNDGNPVSASGSSTEYADPFDVMGGGSTTSNHHYGPWFKNRLGWLPDSAVTTVASSGTYRITRFDARDTPLTQPLALALYRDGSRVFWVGFRQNFPGTATLASGAYVQWGASTNQGSLLLDMTTPGSSAADAGLALGATFNDSDYGISIRPVAKGGTSPSEFLDVEVTMTPPALPVVFGWGSSNPAMPPVGLKGVVAIAAGANHSLALGIDGAITGWGSTSYGQTAPPSSAMPAVAIAAGDSTSGSVKADGTVVLWGDSAFGQTSVPAGLNNVKQLAIGTNHVLALKNDGTVVAWGSNSNGQATVPVGLAGVAAVAAGSGRSTALKSDGTVVQWGADFGAIPAGLSGVTAIAAAGVHALALKSDGTVVAWGSNNYGQAIVPAGLSGVVAIGNGALHSLAVRADGAVVSWGYGNAGQTTVPTGLPGIVAVAGGDSHSLALSVASGEPVVLAQPVDRVVTQGADTTFETTVYASPPPTLRWQRRAAGSDAWTDLADGGAYLGAATRQLSIASTTLAMSGDQFRCLATRAGGGTSVSTQAALLTVRLPAPEITAQPAAQIGRMDSGATFSVTATGTGAVSYQWLKDGVAMAGATGSSFTIATLGPGDAGFYSVVVSDANGSVTSHGAWLDVHPAVYPDVVTARSTGVVQLRARSAEGFAAVAGPNGTIYFAGDFLGLGGLARTGVARLAADGTVDASWVPPAFDHGDVRALALQPDGRLIVGGGFTSADGIAAGGVARLNSDGTLDTSFSLGGSGFGGIVEHLAVQADGRILVAGVFLTFNGGPGSYLLRLNADGSRDTSFPSTGVVSGSVYGLLVQPDGRIVVGGLFTTAGGSARGRIARLHADGTLDASFAAGAGFNGVVYGLAQISNDRILVGGAFSTFDGVTRNGVAMLDANGALDPAFDPGGGSTLVRSVGQLSDGRIVVAGAFSTFAGSTQRFYARLTSTGALDATGTLTTQLDGSITRLTVLPDDRVIVLGISRSDAVTRHMGIARILGNTIEPVYTFEAVQNAAVQSMLPTGDGNWLVGGDFISADGLARHSLARLTREGMLDTSWDPGAGFRMGNFVSTVNTWVHTLQRAPDGRIAAGGEFVTYQGSPAGDFAFLRSDGNFAAGVTFSDVVFCSALQPDGKLLLGGNFSTVAGVSSPRLVRLNTDGSVDTTFAVGSGFAGTVRAIAVQPDGRILVGGSFLSYQGATAPYFLRLQTDGSLDAAFSARGGAGASVRAIVVQPDGRILVGGSFSTIAGASRSRVARLTAEGAVDPGFTAEVSSVGSVYELMLQADGRVLVGSGGVVSSAGNYGGLVRLNADGTRDRSFVVQGVPAVHFNTTFEHLAFTPEGRILAGGSRIGPAGAAGSGFVVLEPPGSPPRITVQPQAQSVVAGNGVELSVAAESTSAAPLAFQWYRNGVAIAGATGATYRVPSAQAFHAGSYTVVVRSGSASVTSVAVALTVNAAPASDARLMNLSTRAYCKTGDSILIPGFVIEGSGSKRMLIRGIGPALAAFGVSGALADPQMTVYRGSVSHAANDNWGANPNVAEILATTTSVGAFPLASGSADSALLLNLTAGAYTVVTAGAGGGMGIALVELYDADPGLPGAQLCNISTRAEVGVGERVMIPGFVVSDLGPRTFLVRAVGPTLTGFGIAGTLADPQLAIVRGSTAILANDNWDGIAGSATTASVAAQVGAFALTAGSRDAAFVVTLPPGAYTVQASGVGTTTGVALVEVYLVP